MPIVHVLDAPEAVPTLARWFVEEWSPWYGPDGPGDAQADLAACSSRSELPICLVALNGDNDALGTAALKSESVGSELGVGPWLAALLVGREYRGKGVGSSLVEAIEGEAYRLGFTSIYTSSENDEILMTRRGWKAIGTTASLKGPITVYRRELQDKGPSLRSS
jgi:GNAT superfamily N-acetyltransferase